jgi:hypothetical protein
VSHPIGRLKLTAVTNKMQHSGARKLLRVEFEVISIFGSSIQHLTHGLWGMLKPMWLPSTKLAGLLGLSSFVNTQAIGLGTPGMKLNIFFIRCLYSTRRVSSIGKNASSGITVVSWVLGQVRIKSPTIDD